MRTARIRTLWWISIVAILPSFFVSTGALQAQQRIRITHSSRSNTATPLYVGVSKGFFREEGLEVELIQANPRLGAMAVINGDHRGRPEPTDVLAFPVDGPEARGWRADGPPPELGDVVICPEAAREPLETLAVHGLLHLLGYDHETDEGEMLALQGRLVAEAP